VSLRTAFSTIHVTYFCISCCSGDKYMSRNGTYFTEEDKGEELSDIDNSDVELSSPDEKSESSSSRSDSDISSTGDENSQQVFSSQEAFRENISLDTKETGQTSQKSNNGVETQKSKKAHSKKGDEEAKVKNLEGPPSNRTRAHDNASKQKHTDNTKKGSKRSKTTGPSFEPVLVKEEDGIKFYQGQFGGIYREVKTKKGQIRRIYDGAQNIRKTAPGYTPVPRRGKKRSRKNLSDNNANENESQPVKKQKLQNVAGDERKSTNQPNASVSDRREAKKKQERESNSQHGTKSTNESESQKSTSRHGEDSHSTSSNASRHRSQHTKRKTQLKRTHSTQNLFDGDNAGEEKCTV